MPNWLILAATLPTQPSALRVRVWRALKATGAGSLREGVYLLPEHAPTAAALQDLAHTITKAGAEAHLLVVPARNDAQERAFRALVDRTAAYADLLQAVKQARTGLKKAGEPQGQRLLRSLDQQLLAVQATDFFPGPAREQAVAALGALRDELRRRFSPGEPTSDHGTIDTRALAEHQGRTWATRRRPWVDRLATAWLVQRFVDRSPRFIWLDDPLACPPDALGYDFDGAAFTHVGARVSFEVLAASFGLAEDPALRRLGELVHYIDVGGVPVDEAAGLETLIRGLQAQHPHDDDALLAAALPLFDTLYAAMKASS